MKAKKQGPLKPVKNEPVKIDASSDGYPAYPAGDDIYHANKEEEDIDPEDLLKQKPPNEKGGGQGKTGSNLDVPGAELDDEQENIGSEDEENNYYSVGGDDHNDLDESRD